MPKGQPFIPADRLRPIFDVLFNKRRFSGQEIAARLGYVPNTLYTQFRTFGVPAKRAVTIADLLTDWSRELLEISLTIRALAAEVSAPPPLDLENLLDADTERADAR